MNEVCAEKTQNAMSSGRDAWATTASDQRSNFQRVGCLHKTSFYLFKEQTQREQTEYVGKPKTIVESNLHLTQAQRLQAR